MARVTATLHVLCVLTVWTGSSDAAEVDLTLARYLQTEVDRGAVDTDFLFDQFKIIFNKSYEHDERRRRDIFKDNVQYIKRHNLEYARGNKSYTLAVNEFSDLEHEEFLRLYTTKVSLRRPRRRSESPAAQAKRPLPTTIDWRSQGYVTDVLNQGECGACWAFSATGSVEGQLCRKTKRLVSLSEQQLVDCDKFNFGCKDGYVDLAFQYIREAGGLEPENVYPYKAVQTLCKYDRNQIVAGSKVSRTVDVLEGSETALQTAVAEVGPVSVGVDASHKSFQSYSYGIYDEPNCSPFYLNHGILAIGYGTYPQKYWLAKNSYGKTWGEAGYIRMARDKANQCGIATLAMYPVL